MEGGAPEQCVRYPALRIYSGVVESLEDMHSSSIPAVGFDLRLCTRLEDFWFECGLGGDRNKWRNLDCQSRNRREIGR
jgi:hypothetical protein